MEERSDPWNRAQSRNLHRLHGVYRLAQEMPTDERAQADSEEGQCETGGNLVRLQGERQETKEEGEEGAGNHGGEIPQQQAAGDGGDGKGGQGAHEHHPFDTQVEYA